MATLSWSRASIEEIYSYPVEISAFEDTSEQRRLTVDKPIIGFSITTSVRTKTQMQAIRTDFATYRGEHTHFSFVSPFDDTTYTCRFDSEMKTTFTNGHFVCKFKIKVIYGDES